MKGQQLLRKDPRGWLLEDVLYTRRSIEQRAGTSRMVDNVDYYISAVKTKGEHITHVRVHKALPDKSFAPHGIIQPRSTVIVNLRNKRTYKTLVLAGNQARPGDPVKLVEHGTKFYLRTSLSSDPGDDLGDMPSF